MKIWVDADACPKGAKEILFRAAGRTGFELILVANQSISVPELSNIRTIRVPQGFDKADDEIARRISPEDLVITSDIPLAAEVLEIGAQALNTRGEVYRTETIKQRLGMRDFMETLRSSGIQSGGQNAYSNTDKQAFANELDKILTRAQKQSASKPK